MPVGSERPNFREDYQYEKAFNAFYKVHHAAAAWPTARIRCEGEGAELLVPQNIDEADAMPLLITTMLNKFPGVYVGIHDLYSERTFVSINGTTIMNSILDLLWEPKQPINRGGRCVAMRRSGRYFVHPCHEPLPFICKVKATKIIYHEAYWQLGLNDSCYLVHVEPQTWHDAYATCLAAGGHLVIIQNRNQAEHIRDLFKQNTGLNVPDNEFAFVGFSDLFQRYHYKTIHGERIDETGYSDWDVKCGESGGQEGFRCGGIRRSGLLTVGNCSVPAIFFCEKPINSTRTLRTLRQIKFYDLKPHSRSKMQQLEYYDDF
ncbi:C-type lectin 17 [Aphomia sociella]